MPPGSWYGTLLKGTINLSPQTTVLQAVVWVAYIVPVMLLFLRRTRGRRVMGEVESIGQGTSRDLVVDHSPRANAALRPTPATRQ